MKKISLLIIASTLFAVAFAQDNDSTLTQSVNIEKDYTPQVVKVKRTEIELPSSTPKIEKNEVVYTSETEPMTVESQFYPLAAADAKNTGRPTYKPGCARIGIGFPLVWMADVWTPVITNKTDYLGMQLNHYGIYTGSKKLIRTQFDLDYNHHFKRGLLYSVVGFSNDYYSYYGTDSVFKPSTYYREEIQRDVAGFGLIPQTRVTTQAHALIGFGSEKELKGWSYNGNLSYEFLTTNPTILKDGVSVRGASTREHKIALNLFGGYNLNSHHINADLSVAAYLYNNPSETAYLVDSTKKVLRDTTYANNNWKPQFLITFNPRYEKDWKNVSLRAGAKLWFSVNKGKVVAAAPDIEARYKFREIFDVYGGIGGDYKFTSFADVLEENRYYDMSTRPEKNDYTPLNFHAGINIKPVHGLSIGASVSYQMIENTHFFRNVMYACTETPNQYPKTNLEYVYGNVFSMVDAKARLLTAEARIAYNLKERYNFHFKGKYNGWKVLTDGVDAWNKPKWEADAGIEALFTKNFAGNINFYYGSKRTAALPEKDGQSYRTVDLKPIYDLNLSLSYTFPKNWSLFLQANNLLALSEKLRYQDWYGYDNIGFNILAGLSVSF